MITFRCQVSYLRNIQCFLLDRALLLASKKIAYNEFMRVLNFMETVASTQKQRSDVPQT